MRISDWSSDVCSSDLALGVEILDLADIGELDRPPIADRDLRLAEVVGGLRVAQHAHRLFGPRNLGLAARGVQLDLAELLVDCPRRQPLSLELLGIENDPNHAADPADRKSAA